MDISKGVRSDTLSGMCFRWLTWSTSIERWNRSVPGRFLDMHLLESEFEIESQDGSSRAAWAGNFVRSTEPKLAVLGIF